MVGILLPRSSSSERLTGRDKLGEVGIPTGILQGQFAQLLLLCMVSGLLGASVVWGIGGAREMLTELELSACIFCRLGHASTYVRMHHCLLLLLAKHIVAISSILF